ncbi:MFS monocarboxylate transporter [Colletotrichum musicola]|uniref:MFS monocarboxylate transporter n=1 Tax=Colletotrichum musicola TaxID=2175873 RepID=A0A8H6IR75_9PEZI|nr:MFS monocarboxylate transporter [Colletotrichum musicola]
MLRESPEPAGQEKAFRPDSPRSWMIALLSHLTIFSTWGFANAFGVFQTYYVRDMRIGDESAVAWIGSTQLSLLFCTGVLSGRALITSGNDSVNGSYPGSAASFCRDFESNLHPRTYVMGGGLLCIYT